MNLKPLFEVIDAKPFRPFEIGTTDGDRTLVSHPDNIFLIPNRQNVNHIVVYREEPASVMIWPEALAAIYLNGKTAKLD